MSNKLLDKVEEIDGLERSEAFVLVYLANHANDQGICFPGVERLAKQTRSDKRTVEYVLRNLEAMGLIKRIAGAKRNSRTTYQLTFDNVLNSGGKVTRPHEGIRPPPKTRRKAKGKEIENDVQSPDRADDLGDLGEYDEVEIPAPPQRELVATGVAATGNGTYRAPAPPIRWAEMPEWRDDRQFWAMMSDDQLKAYFNHYEYHVEDFTGFYGKLYVEARKKGWR